MRDTARVQRRRHLDFDAVEPRALMAVTVNQYPLPTPRDAPGGLAFGPDGNLWFVESGPNEGVGVLNPTSHAMTILPLPTARSYPAGITAGPNEKLWFTERLAGKIGKIDPITHAITEFSVPNPAGPYAITTGPDGNLWFTEDGAIGMFKPTTHEFAVIPIPVDGTIESITAGPDGNLWFTARRADSVGMINPSTHAFAEFPLPPNSGPLDITAGPDGSLWFTEYGFPSAQPWVGGIGIISPTTHAITEFPTPSGWPATGITAGPGGDLYFLQFSGSYIASDGTIGSIGMIDPTTHAMVVQLLRNGQTEDTTWERIVVDPGGHLWSMAPNAIEELQVSPPAALSPQPAGAWYYRAPKKGVSDFFIDFNTAPGELSAGNPGSYSVFAAVKTRRKVRTGRSLAIKHVYVSGQFVGITLARPHKGLMEVVVHPGILGLDGLVSTGPFTLMIKKAKNS